MNKKMEIVGVKHNGDRIRDAVIEYIDRKYSELNRIMLELPVGYERLHDAGMYMGFFSDLANYYEARDVEVVPCDKNRFDLTGETLDGVIEDWRSGRVRSKRSNVWSIVKGIFNGRNAIRNVGMNDVFQDVQSEVCVVGGHHGRYLKKQNPNSDFVFFTDGDWFDMFFDKITFRSADKIYHVD